MGGFDEETEAEGEVDYEAEVQSMEVGSDDYLLLPRQQQVQAQEEVELGPISAADIQGVSMSDSTVQFKGVVIQISADTLLPFMPGFQPGNVSFEEAAGFHSRDFFIQHHGAVPAANKQVKLNSITPKKLRALCKQRYHFFYERSNQSKVPWKFLSVVYAEYAGTKVDWADAMCKRMLHAFDGVVTGKLRKVHNEKLVLEYLTHMAKCKLQGPGINDLLELDDFDCLITLDEQLENLRPSPGHAFSFHDYGVPSSDSHFL
eukprot:TRINITY_DN25020_c0_g1_i1.p1 TRINITY_DN25020_c0_g1~~TRINITY_DN25020_c0_g1_i1.p1  ORF type:complete len:260 (+),score=46.40 TRINITY_DN25020_c0_g1_i1:54-833(+)